MALQRLSPGVYRDLSTGKIVRSATGQQAGSGLAQAMQRPMQQLPAQVAGQQLGSIVGQPQAMDKAAMDKALGQLGPMHQLPYKPPVGQQPGWMQQEPWNNPQGWGMGSQEGGREFNMFGGGKVQIPEQAGQGVAHGLFALGKMKQLPQQVNPQQLNKVV